MQHGTSLKRTRSPTGVPLPPIDLDLALQVYTHPSLRRETDRTPEQYGDNERLAELGSSVLEMAVTFALFNVRPMLKMTEICVSSECLTDRNDELKQNPLQTRRKEILSVDLYNYWVTIYRMRPRLRCHPNVSSTLTSPEV